MRQLFGAVLVFLLFLYSEEVDQTLVTPKLGREVEEAFRVAVDGLVQPVRHGAADAGVRVHVLAGNSRLAVAYRPFPPYPVDGDFEAHRLGDSAVTLHRELYAVAELALHLAALLGYGGDLLALGELQSVALRSVANRHRPPPRLPQELLGGEDVGVRGVGYGVAGHGYKSSTEFSSSSIEGREDLTWS